jgi:hypothetical protein
MSISNWHQIEEKTYELKTEYDVLATLSYNERYHQWILECESLKLYTSLIHSDTESLLDRASSLLNITCTLMVNSCKYILEAIK